MSEQNTNATAQPVESKPKRTYKRRSQAEVKAELLAKLAAIEAAEAVEKMGDHPVMAKVISIRETLDYRSGLDHNLVNGYGKGRPVVERIQVMRTELADLEASAERAVGFLPDVDAMRSGLDAIQAQVLAGDFDGDETPDFGFLTDAYRNWTETTTERNRRLEREARAAQRETQGNAPVEADAEIVDATIAETVTVTADDVGDVSEVLGN